MEQLEALLERATESDRPMSFHALTPHEASLSPVIELVVWVGGGGALFPGLQEPVIKPDELQRYT